jgi:hypothetical protein
MRLNGHADREDSQWLVIGPTAVWYCDSNLGQASTADDSWPRLRRRPACLATLPVGQVHGMSASITEKALRRARFLRGAMCQRNIIGHRERASTESASGPMDHCPANL